MQPETRSDRGATQPQWERWLPELYLALSLVLTTLLCFLTAPFFAPDEANQSLRALSLRKGDWVLQQGPEAFNYEAGTEIDTGVLAAMERMNSLRMAWERRNADFLDRSYGPLSDRAQQLVSALRWTRRTSFAGFGNTAVYPPWLYGPGVAGWALGEATDRTVLESLRLARLFSAWTACLLGWLALRLSLAVRWRLLAAMLLPSVLFLNASCSQDALLLPAAALAAALVSRPLVLARAFTRGELAAACALLASIASARPPYLVLGVLVFLPVLQLGGRVQPSAGRREWRGATLAFLLIVAAVGGWHALNRSLDMDTAEQANPEAQIVFLKTHPLAALSALTRGTLEAAADLAHRGLYVVGWNDLLPHRGAAAVLCCALLLVALAGPGALPRRGPGWPVVVSVIVTTLLALSLAEYIIWTPPGWYTVWGVQPRYWLPLLPFAALLPGVRPLAAGGGERVRTGVFAAATVTLCAVACTLPCFVAQAFYREGMLQVLRLNLR